MLNILLLACVTQWLYWMQSTPFLSQTNQKKKENVNISHLELALQRCTDDQKYRKKRKDAHTKELCGTDSLQIIPPSTTSVEYSDIPLALSGSSSQLPKTFCFVLVCLKWDARTHGAEWRWRRRLVIWQGTERSDGGDGPWFLLREAVGGVGGVVKGADRTLMQAYTTVQQRQLV